MQMRCDKCGSVYAVAAENAELWLGAPCQRTTCGGFLEEYESGEINYYGRLYSAGDLVRINAREHTGLLERPDREQLEIDFKRSKDTQEIWDPNVLSCTPTLEMGIDIGDLSTVILCSMPPAQSQFLQRAGRAGRKDGNALTLAVANARPHDLYFYSDPLDMIAGEVTPPKIFLRASAVLERQFVAFCMDSWVKKGIPDGAIPDKVGIVLKKLDACPDDMFPFNFLNYVQSTLSRQLNSFMQMFAAYLDDSARDELQMFARGKDANDSPMYVKILDAFEDLKKQQDTFYEEEWNRIVIAQEALTLEKYVKATRNGRGTRLDRKKRMQVWKVFENYQNLMKENQIRDINTAMYESTKLLQSAGRKPRYASIIIDEGQDFSDNAYRLIRALAGEEHPNDIFIVGDSHQRIYRNYPTLSKCGINVRGRSSILKINYRTTEEIRKHAFALLNGISFDDLDEDLDLGDKCQSLTHGEKPIVENFENANDEFDFLLREVKKLKENGVSLTDICVVARTKKLVDDYIALFIRAGIRSYAIKRNKVDDRSFDGLRVATMHRVKGLEFKYVFIAAVNNRIIPLPFAINKTDAVSEVESITSEKCLLYVAMTRAQKGVYITSYGRPSEFLV